MCRSLSYCWITAPTQANRDLPTIGNNALHWSVITRQLSLLGRFVELGTPIDAKRADGQTPVLLATNGATDYWYRATRGWSHPSIRNASVMIGNLLANGANYTISVAAAVGDQERVEQLLKKDDDLARRLDSARVSPLSYAAREGHLHIVRLLLDRDADPNIPEEGAPDGWHCCACFTITWMSLSCYWSMAPIQLRRGFERVLSHDLRGVARRPGKTATTTLATLRGIHTAVLHERARDEASHSRRP